MERVPSVMATSSAPQTVLAVSDFPSSRCEQRSLHATVFLCGYEPRIFYFRELVVSMPSLRPLLPVSSLQAAVSEMTGKINLTYLDCSAPGSCDNDPYLSNTSDVFMYFQSLAATPALETNSFRLGAVADTLTSFAGILTNTSGQMPALAFLDAGATASYGTVVEPCNFEGEAGVFTWRVN
jgi:hypothetical protein